MLHGYVPDLPLPILAQQPIEQVRRIQQMKSAPSLLVLRSKPAGSLLYLILPTLDSYLALNKSRNCSRCTHGVRYIYGDISMSTHIYIHARLQFVSHFDFRFFSGHIYGVDHGRGNDFDEVDSDTLGVGASCRRRGRPVRLVWPRPVLECTSH